MSELPAISLFSGAGGLDLGAESAGYAIRASVEHEHDAAETLRANFPNSAILNRDIKTLSTKELIRAAGLRKGEAELLVGGPPCTPFSKSGNWLEYKRKGLDPEASLLDHYLRVLAETRPRTFLLENVYGLAYRNHNMPWLEHLLKAAGDLGYYVNHRVLLHSGPHETRTKYDETLTPHVTTGDAIGDLADRDELAEEQEAVNGKYGHLLPEIPPGSNYLFFTAKRGHPKPLFEWRKRYWSFLLKLDPAQPSPTIQAQPGPYVGPFHWNNRRLRLGEILRLQTFPEDHSIAGSRRSAQVQVGNAVPPVLAQRVAAALRAAA